LRGWLPADIGNIMWIAPIYPCIQPFIPWYYGINMISSDFEKVTYTDALHDYNIKLAGYKKRYPNHACWVFDDFASKIDSCYDDEIKSVREWKTDFEMNIFKALKIKEGEILNVYRSNPDKAQQMLTDLSNSFAEKALKDTKNKLQSLENASR
jgi:dipeptidase